MELTFQLDAPITWQGLNIGDEILDALSGKDREAFDEAGIAEFEDEAN